MRNATILNRIFAPVLDFPSSHTMMPSTLITVRMLITTGFIWATLFAKITYGKGNDAEVDWRMKGRLKNMIDQLLEEKLKLYLQTLFHEGIDPSLITIDVYGTDLVDFSQSKRSRRALHSKFY